MKRRVIALWLPRLATDRLRRDATRPADNGTPLVTTVEVGGGLLLAALEGAAEQAGLAPGMTLAGARAGPGA